MRGTPAFQNDVLEGDIIRQINGMDILDAKHCLGIIGREKGKTVSLTILRDGKEIQKEFELGN